MPFVISWAVLATAVLLLAIYRYFASRNEDDFIHVNAGPVVQQQVLAKKLDFIDRWGKILTILAAVYGMVIGALFMYSTWVERGTTIQ